MIGIGWLAMMGQELDFQSGIFAPGERKYVLIRDPTVGDQSNELASSGACMGL